MSKSKKKKKAAKRKKSEKKSRAIQAHAHQLDTMQIDSNFSSIDKTDFAEDVTEVDDHCYPFDENLLNRARTQWQFGDWQSLAALDRNILQHHPDRAKLALLAAAGHLQLGDTRVARQFISLAKEWGCTKKLISQILISGVYNSLGCVSASCGQNKRALEHIETAVAMGTPGGNVRLLAQERVHNIKKRQDSIGLYEVKKQLNLAAGEIDKGDLSAAKLLVDECFVNKELVDALESVTMYLLSSHSTNSMLFNFCYMLALKFRETKDNLMVAHYINTASEFVEEKGSLAKSQYNLLSREALAIGQTELSIYFMVRSQCADSVITDFEKKRLVLAYNNIRAASKQQHGHDLLLCYLQDKFKTSANSDKDFVLIEIGTTRENVPGQGSTRLLAEFCKNNKIHFITVDMDPNNSRIANSLFEQMEVPFEAITMKGEDYLQSYPGTFDFVFLDAYDFDHGKHSTLRQSRYIKYLGGRIDEEQCHKMHLDCAKSILEKLSEQGVVCIDDTWQDEQGRWTAKGTLALPFLLDNGFLLIEARNRAALLKQTKT